MALDMEKQDFDAVETAIAAAEKQTSVEFFAVLAERSDDYRFVAGFFASLWLFVFGLIYALVARIYWYDVTALMLAAMLLGGFLSFNMIFRFNLSLAMRFVPKSVRFRRARANAAQQFLAHGISGTSERNGVLIFVSMAEHYAEILADSGIAEKTEQSFWDDAVAKLVNHAKTGDISSGYVSTLELLAQQLSPKFPPNNRNTTGLDNKIVVLSSN